MRWSVAALAPRGLWLLLRFYTRYHGTVEERARYSVEPGNDYNGDYRFRQTYRCRRHPKYDRADELG
jgi:hypothetical protein